MLVTVFSEPTWKAMAVRQLEFFRALRGEMRGGGRFLPAVPCTRNVDVLALATYWTEQLARAGDNASNTFHRLLYSAWREVVHRVMRVEGCATARDLRAQLRVLERDAPAHDPERRMRSVTRAVAVSASDAARRAAERGRRSMRDPRWTFPAAKTWDDAAQMQRDAFAKLRGEDRVVGRLIARIPRTTVADVRQLAAYWSNGLAKVHEHNSADVSSRHVVDRWRAAVAEVDRLALTTEPSSVYAHNTDFWEALMTIAIQVAVTAEAPTRWQLAKEAGKHALIELPQTLKNAARDVLGGVLAKPLLYAGIGLGGLALAALVLRRPAPTSRS